MRIRTFRIFLICVLLPTLSYASGGDVLGTLWLMLVVIVAFILVLIFADINWKGKIFLTVLFVIAEAVSIILTNDMTFRENMVKINIITVAVPIGTLLVSYLGLRQKFKKTNKIVE